MKKRAGEPVLFIWGEPMEIRTISIAQINPAPYNPRKDLQPGDPEYEKLRRSIEEFGFVEPLVWNRRTGNLVGGHQRLKVLQELGQTEIEVSAVDMPDDREKVLNLALNKITGDWDLEKLNEVLAELNAGDFDIELTGFSEKEIEDLLQQFENPGVVEEDDFDVEAEIETTEEPVTKRGDIWILGRHRLMCGDATLPNDVKKLMAGEKADMVFTDPPYGVNVKGGKNKKNIAGDLTQVAIPFSFELICEIATKEDARLYFCGGEGNIGLYGKLFERYLAQIPRHLVWVKNGFVIKPNGYHNQYELIFYGYKAGGGGIASWFAGRTEHEASDVWRVNRDAASKYEHPTQKPVELPARAIRNSSPPGGIVYDAFGGSGSTLLASEQLGRSCYMMEIAPVYCDVAVKRWEQHTEEKAVRLKAAK